MDERHGRWRRQDHPLQLAEIGEVDAEQTHGRAVLPIPGSLEIYIGAELIVRHPGESQPAGEGVVVAQILAVGALHITVLIQRGD